jgi:two-component system, sensor histidine kinase
MDARTEEKPNILMVDDIPANLVALEALLGEARQHLFRARSGPEALRATLERDFALILLDVTMPGMDGYETARLIHGRGRTRDTPIIFMTASHPGPEEISLGYSVGAVDYLLKPLVPEILRSKVAFFVELAAKRRLVELQASELARANFDLKEARNRAEQESAAKSAFLANISHELRTPLNAIIGFSELLVQDMAGPLEERPREFASHILSSGQHLLDLVNDLLDISQVEAGRMNIVREGTELGTIVDAVRATAERLAEKQGVTLSFEVAALPNLFVDPLRIRQVLFNLLSNAIKFTPRGGSVRLTAARVGDWVEVVVMDTGIGISEENLPRLFRPFEQLVMTSQNKPPGTGLGLVLTKRLLALHGGSISVSSTLGSGSTFTARLPVPAAAERAVG